MTGPNGEKSRGFWEFQSVEAPRSFEVKDGFLGPDGKQAPDMPTMQMRFTFEPHDGGTRMVTLTTFPSSRHSRSSSPWGWKRASRRRWPNRRRAGGGLNACSARGHRPRTGAGPAPQELPSAPVHSCGRNRFRTRNPLARSSEGSAPELLSSSRRESAVTVGVYLAERVGFEPDRTL